MDLLRRLTIKNLLLNKKRTIVTIVGIILSVALITAVASMYMSAIGSLIAYEIRYKGDYHVEFRGVPVEDIESFEKNKDIEKMYLTQDIGYSELKESQNDYKPYVFVKAFSESSMKNLAVNLTEGRLPQNENEILIPTHLKTNGRVEFHVGDEITLNLGTRVGIDGNELTQENPFRPNDGEEFTYDARTGEMLSSENYDKSQEKIIDTRAKTYKIVGICERPSTGIEDYTAPGYTFITLLNENHLKGKVDIFARYTKSALNQETFVTSKILDISEDSYKRVMYGYEFDDEEAWERSVAEFERAKYKVDINSYLMELEENPFNKDGDLKIVVVIICTIIIVTSVFCIKNSIDISITEKTKQYGMLRSIGATKKQIKKNVYFEAFALGVVGIPLGILSGFLASFILIKISNSFLEGMFTENFELVFSFSWIAVGVSILLGALTLWLSSVRSAKRASKITPIIAIRNSGDIKIKAKKLKTPKLISGIFGIGGEISYKNLKRNRKKYRTTVISIVVSVAVFIAIYFFSTFLFDEIKDEMSYNDYNLDVYLYYEDYEEDLNQILNLENIDEYAILKTIDAVVDKAKYSKEFLEVTKAQYADESELKGYVEIYSLGDAAYRNYLKELGLKYEDVKDKAILYNTVEAQIYDEYTNKMRSVKTERYGYKVGDTIQLINETENDEEQSERINLEIAKVTENRPFGIYQGLPALIVSDEFINQYEIALHNPHLVVYSSNPDKLQDEIEEIIKDKEFNLYNANENIRMMKNFFTLLSIFVYGFIIVISLIGVTNIFNTITTSMELRRSEFASLRSIGMTNKEFNRMIRLESLFMGLKSLLIGVTIGLGLSYLIYKYLKDEFIAIMKFEIPWIAIAISVVVVFLLITMIMKYSLGKIKKQNTIETIRNENI